jgi:two-component system, NtrC family, response regulator GlrR
MEMKSARVILFDLHCLEAWVEALKLEVQAIPDTSMIVHHARSHGTSASEAAERLAGIMPGLAPDLMILMFSSASQMAGPAIFNALRGESCPPPVVVVPCSDSPGVISELFQLGASDYLLPPFRPGDVQPRLERLLAYRRAQMRPASSVKEAIGLQQIVGESPALLEQVKRIPRLAQCDACVLITGETGTGKEVCARALHYLSSRAKHPFVPLNCGAIPADLLENELFGHTAGAYTSAQSSHTGLIREADGGTLFLDEVDSLSLAAQVKLLRFLQEREYRPLGSSKACKADVRIMAASNGELETCVQAGKLRKDLYYRLNVLRLHLPPLRQRQQDIPLLARHFLVKFVARCSPSACDFAPCALKKLSLYDWPGNVRELENAVERAAVLCEGGLIQGADLDLPVVAEPAPPPESFAEQKARVVNEFEQRYVHDLLTRFQGNIGQAARAAHKNRRVFFELMRKHHIRVERSGVANLVIMVDKNVQAQNCR